MKKLILNELLDRYERSKAFREGASTRRILVNVSSCPQFSSFMEQGDSKREFLEALETLRQDGLLDYAWERFEKGNLVDKVWLNTDMERLEQSYRAAGRISRHQKLLVLEKQICAALSETGLKDEELKRGDLTGFLLEELDEIRTKKRIPRFFFDEAGSFPTDGIFPDGQPADARKNRSLLCFLREICFFDIKQAGIPPDITAPGTDTPSPVVTHAREEELERVLSLRLFGDSKYFERELRSKALSILRYLAKRDGRECDEDGQLLAERGIVKWPEILEFRGCLKADLDDGRILDYSDHIYGACINGEAVKHVEKVHLAGVSTIICIENKANYTWYLRTHQTEGALVLYHGGFFSPTKGRWLRLIAEAAEQNQAVIYHWSDIDLGGFRIFLRLKKEIFRDAKPLYMDAETLSKYRDRSMPLEKGAYRDSLIRCLADPEYSMFAEVISLMLSENIRLEQEAEIWEI